MTSASQGDLKGKTTKVYLTNHVFRSVYVDTWDEVPRCFKSSDEAYGYVEAKRNVDNDSVFHILCFEVDITLPIYILTHGDGIIYDVTNDYQKFEAFNKNDPNAGYWMEDCTVKF